MPLRALQALLQALPPWLSVLEGSGRISRSADGDIEATPWWKATHVGEGFVAAEAA